MITNNIVRADTIAHLSEKTGLDKEQVKASLKIIAKAISKPNTKLKLRDVGVFTTRAHSSVTVKTPQLEQSIKSTRVSLTFKQPVHARGNV